MHTNIFDFRIQAQLTIGLTHEPYWDSNLLTATAGENFCLLYLIGQ